MVIYIGIQAGDFLLKNKRLPAIPAAGEQPQAHDPQSQLCSIQPVRPSAQNLRSYTILPHSSTQPVRAELPEARIFSFRHYRICGG
jgi:hypothetical protein